MSQEAWSTSLDAQELHAVGHLAHLEYRLDQCEKELAGAPDWRPARALSEQLAWVRAKLTALEQNWGRRLLVAIVGPSGAGKSTLLNALAGAELSPMGLERPTTRQVVAYASDTAAAESLTQALGPQQVRLVTSPRATRLEYLTLLDTPDTNTLPENQVALSRALAQTDLILAVFPAHNPRLQDNLAFLKPFVRALPAENIIPVLNQVDRVPSGELDEVAGTLRHTLEADWGLHDARVYLVSARAGLPGYAAPEDERPLHRQNQLGELEQLIYGRLNRAREVADRRQGRAARLVVLWQEEAAAALRDVAEDRQRAATLVEGLDAQTRDAVMQTLASEGLPGEGVGLHSRLYALLASRWWGPVGWLVGMWALVLRVAAALRGLGAWRLGPGREGSGDRLLTLATAEGAWRAAIERLYAAVWPPAADALVAAGFDAALREAGAWQNELDARSAGIPAQAEALIEAQLARKARSLSAWPLQVLLNLPVLGLLAWMGIGAVISLLRQTGLPADYLRTSGLALAACWLLAFVLLQALVSVTLRSGLRKAVARGLGDLYAAIPLSGWRWQLSALDRLAALCAERERG